VEEDGLDRDADREERRFAASGKGLEELRIPRQLDSTLNAQRIPGSGDQEDQADESCARRSRSDSGLILTCRASQPPGSEPRVDAVRPRFKHARPTDQCGRSGRHFTPLWASLSSRP
jgi:hypothetical protein